MLAFRLVYHEGYDLHFGSHVFPSTKYKLVRSRLLREGWAEEGDFLEPEPAPIADLNLAHDEEWVRKLDTGTLAYHEILRLEVPYSRQMVHAFWLAAGGTTLAARMAMADGVACNIGGGFHHAHAGHGEGFCAINDMAVAIRVLQREKAIERALVVDCDVHHGNGTASIFANDPSVYTISIHQLNNYPHVKPPSTVDIDLADGVPDNEYLNALHDPLIDALDKFAPQLLVYVAGADPYYDDQLGGLCLTMDGLRARDYFVVEAALRRRIPVAVVFAGGYAMQLSDTVAIHAHTILACRDALAECGWKAR